MLDIKLFRENPDIIRESEKRRFRDPAIVDQVIEFDRLWREKKQEINELRRLRNEKSAEIGKIKKKDKKADISGIQNEVKKMKADLEQAEKDVEDLFKKREETRYKVGNIVHESVPVGQGEDANVIVRTWGKPAEPANWRQGHADMVELLDVAVIEKAAEVAGSRTYYLKNDLVFLNLALVNFALDFLERERGFHVFWTPYFLRKEIMEGASELADFEEQLYSDQKEDVFFIATSEQTLVALHYNEIIEPENLPLRYAGFSTNFRREAGAHGRDFKGIFRVHQFEKVEQFIYADPENSWQYHEELIDNAEKMFQKLELPYRVINIASGELNDNAAKKYDIEVWFPAQQTFRETVSCSNCTDFQARKLNIRVGRTGADKEFLHTLNSTAIATSRVICAILENFQEEDGTVKIPCALHPYMGGRIEIKPKKSKKNEN